MLSPSGLNPAEQFGVPSRHRLPPEPAEKDLVAYSAARSIVARGDNKGWQQKRRKAGDSSRGGKGPHTTVSSKSKRHQQALALSSVWASSKKNTAGCLSRSGQAIAP